MSRVEISIKLPIKIIKKDNVFISSCPALDVFSQGNTKEEAYKNIGEAVKLFLITCFEHGTIDTVLKQCGFKPVKGTAKMPSDHRFITVPIPFSVPSACAHACHA